MAEYTVLKEIGLGAAHSASGKTIHRRGDVVLPPASRLLIVQFSGDAGFYILHLNDEGDEITDTFHMTIDEAFAQAKWEYGVSASEWLDRDRE
jgi:hypothetical protein